MKLLCYYISHTFVNSIKKLFRSWVAIFVGIMVLACVGGGIIGGVVGSMAEDAAPDTAQEQLAEEDTPMPLEQKMDITELACTGVNLFLLLLNFYNSDKSGTKIFTMADVNLLFPAPLSPQTVLLFRVLLQMGLSLVGSVYLLFQLPNLILNLGLSPLAAMMILFAWVLLLVFVNLLNIWAYACAAEHPLFRKLIHPVVLGIPVALALMYLVLLKTQGGGYLETAALFNAEWTRWIPVVGWLRGMIMYLVEGKYVLSVLCLLLCVALFAVLVRAIWGMQVDFYEDALSNAAQRQEAMEKAVANGGVATVKTRKDAKAETEIGRGAGASVFFFTPLYNRFRGAHLRFFTNTGLSYLAIGLISALILRNNLHTQSFTIIGAFLLGSSFIRNFGNPIERETERNFLYLVPDSPFRKLAGSLLAGSADTLLDLFPAMLLAALVMGASIPEMLLWLLTAVAFDLFLSSLSALMSRLMPASTPLQLQAAIVMMARMFLSGPTIVLLVLGGVLHCLPLMLGINALVCLGLAAGAVALTSAMLHRGVR